jgi:urease gamma subunit
MIVYFAMMDQLSSDFVLHMDDVKVEECANRLVHVIKKCHDAKSIQELLRKAKVTLDQDDIMDELQRGMLSA